MSTDPAAYTAAVIGYREWVVEDRRLLSRTAGVAWTPGVNTARCYGHRACVAAPGADCDCGLYATIALPTEADPQLVGLGAMVVGAVATWGDLQVHRDAFRAEHARIVALAYPPNASPEVIARLTPVAERYEVELVALAELPRVAERHGKHLAVPQTERPAGGRRRGALRRRAMLAMPAVAREPVEGWQRQIVEPTIAERHLTRDQVYLHLARHQRVLCHLRVYEAPEQPAVVIVGNLDDRGMTVTNTAGELAAELATRILPGEQFAFIEHYPRRYNDPGLYAETGFTPVTFDEEGRSQWGQPVSHQAIEEIVGQPVVVFPAGEYTAANVELVKHEPHAQIAADALVAACPDHGRGDRMYCAEGHSGCMARHARELRRLGPVVLPARAWLRGGSYEGHWGVGRGTVNVDIGGRSLLKAAPRSDGFGWGYGGSGAGDLAAAILTDWHGHAVDPELVEDFKREVVAELPRERFSLSFEEVGAWIGARPGRPVRGLVFVACMAARDAVLAHTTGFGISRELAAHSFECYLPEHAIGQHHTDPFSPAVIASHRGALARARAIVVPYGLPNSAPPTLEVALALDYAQREHTLALVVAALDEAVSIAAVRDHFELAGAELTAAPEEHDPDASRIAAAVCAAIERTGGVQDPDAPTGT
jgi:hypothetical protein